MLLGFHSAVTRHHRITFGRNLRINEKADSSCTAQKRLNAVSCFSKHRSFTADASHTPHGSKLRTPGNPKARDVSSVVVDSGCELRVWVRYGIFGRLIGMLTG